MSDQCPKNWTFETLLVHFKELLDASDKRYEQRFVAQKEAIQKAEASSDARFASVNEFRAALADQQRNLVPRSEAELRLRAMEDDIRLLKETNIMRAGQGAGLHQGWLILVGLLSLAGMVFGIISFFK
jgi:hypothetical protein